MDIKIYKKSYYRDNEKRTGDLFTANTVKIELTEDLIKNSESFISPIEINRHNLLEFGFTNEEIEKTICYVHTVKENFKLVVSLENDLLTNIHVVYDDGNNYVVQKVIYDSKNIFLHHLQHIIDDLRNYKDEDGM